MKQLRIFVMLAALSMILPLAAYAQEHNRHSHRSEINIVNDTDTQISYYITTEKFGRKLWAAKPGANQYPSMDGIRLRVRGDDTIEIADWGKAEIRDVAEYNDGAWRISLRHARHEMRRR